MNQKTRLDELEEKLERIKELRRKASTNAECVYWMNRETEARTECRNEFWRQHSIDVFGSVQYN